MADTPQRVAFYETLGKNIRKWRDQRGLSQEDLANLVGLTRTSLTNIENGRQHPPLYTFCEIADQLKVSILELLPNQEPASDTLDVRKIAGDQVRDKNELQFIESAIRTYRSGSHGHQKKKNSGSGRNSSR
jgi:transcriptional regulator with XRE-family HTH domain